MENSEREIYIRENLVEIFESVKDVVHRRERMSRAGLMLGLQELGSSPQGFLGAYYPVSSNIIVMNKSPLKRILDTDKNLFSPYSFHVLLHEYLHSLGFIDEQTTRQKTYELCMKEFGSEHLATEFSRNMEKFLPNLIYPQYGWAPEKEAPIELVKGFDRSSTWQYIA